MRSWWRRLTSCKTRGRLVLLTLWYTVVAVTVYVFYTLKTDVHTHDGSTRAGRSSGFYSVLFSRGQEAVIADDIAALHLYRADDVRVAGKRADSNAARDEVVDWQGIVLSRSNDFGAVADSGKSRNLVEQRTFHILEQEEEEEQEEIEIVDAGRNSRHKYGGNDSRVPVTTAVDLTSVHYFNATVKPTPPPVVEGYYNIQTGESLRLRCSQCALVSSSGHLVNSSAGAEIDSYPCVLRMNSAPVTGYETDVGIRTTIRIVGHVNLKVLNTSQELQAEILRNQSTRAEKVVVPWLYNVNVNRASDMYFKSARNLSKVYPEVDFFLLTPDKVKIAESLFQTETGLSRQEARTWLSTGWMSMLFAVDVCDKVDVFGLAPENFCIENPNATTLYHYYELDGLRECDYYKRSEEKLTSGHKFITEKAVFARWATKFNIEFHWPAWNLTNIPRNASIETPFLKRFYEAKRSGTLPRISNRTRVIRKVVKRVVKKVIIRRKIPVVQKRPQT
ncbi:alpha-N-acetyl-neuraminyl-2,3-beta-galactosyl-1,3-N-acetyl-galactosaminide alpha-2,6-sialyltransferase-like [Diadema antillarum]|uniref:alpha-N-acetyl-neuraminyl-2,3-beta-galactosyl-1, 3-N-acetyl-galactosaminide alpha-2,6-sialyltransferase-like n=1 Tax=Diadema antillarum TaxID=105358 RepID=UPI003A8C0C8E